MTRFTNIMRWRRCFSRMAMLRVVAPLFAIAQLLPAGVSFAEDGGGFMIVMCTPDRVKTVSWEEATGEPSPFEAPEDDRRGAVACHAVMSDPRGSRLLRTA